MLVKELEWNNESVYTEDDVTGLFIEPFLNISHNCDVVPLYDNSLRFSDDIWDLTKVSHRRVPRRKSTYNFEGLNSEFSIICKAYTIVKLRSRVGKIQSILSYQSKVKSFLLFLQGTEVEEIEEITSDHIIEFLNTLSDFKVTTVSSYMNVLHDFFTKYSLHISKLYWNDISKILSSQELAYQIGVKGESKTSTIDKKYFTQLLNVAIRVMKDNTVETYYQGVACIIVLLAHTGLRNSELRDMPCSALKANPKNKYDVPYFDYITTKNTSTNSGERQMKCVATPLAVTAFYTLLDLYSSSRKKKESDLLIVPERCGTLPVTDTAFDRMITFFCLRYAEEIECINLQHSKKDLKYIHYPTIERTNMAKLINKFEETDTISIPRPHQFRVFLINRMYDKGITLFYIQKHMGHLTREATEGYLRLENEQEQAQKTAKDLATMIINEDVRLLGKNAASLKEAINKHIKTLDKSVYVDFDAIANSTVEAFPMSAKAGGI